MKIVLDSGAHMPTRAHENDAGLDLYAKEGAWIDGGSMGIFDTGVHAAIPRGCAGFIKSRSGMMICDQITTDGTIDSGYTGSIKVALFNHGKEDVMIEAGQRIAQLVIVPYLKVEIELVESLDETERGDGGFGSSGR